MSQVNEPSDLEEGLALMKAAVGLVPPLAALLIEGLRSGRANVDAELAARVEALVPAESESAKAAQRLRREGESER